MCIKISKNFNSMHERFLDLEMKMQQTLKKLDYKKLQTNENQSLDDIQNEKNEYFNRKQELDAIVEELIEKMKLAKDEMLTVNALKNNY